MYCPHCGAPLPEGAYSFCGACGNALSPPAERSVPEKETPKKSGPRKKKMQKRKKESPQPEAKAPVDDGYDGYYDDVRPEDAGETRQMLDRDTLRRILGIAAGAVLAICACAAILYVL